jgi:hypothetical protein
MVFTKQAIVPYPASDELRSHPHVQAVFLDLIIVLIFGVDTTTTATTTTTTTTTTTNNNNNNNNNVLY